MLRCGLDLVSRTSVTSRPCLGLILFARARLLRVACCTAAGGAACFAATAVPAPPRVVGNQSMEPKATKIKAPLARPCLGSGG
eukprot:780935-Amphidinium_carterae.2